MTFCYFRGRSFTPSIHPLDPGLSSSSNYSMMMMSLTTSRHEVFFPQRQTMLLLIQVSRCGTFDPKLVSFFSDIDQRLKSTQNLCSCSISIFEFVSFFSNRALGPSSPLFCWLAKTALPNLEGSLLKSYSKPRNIWATLSRLRVATLRK